MLIPPGWAGIGNLDFVLANECLCFCVGEGVLGFVAAPDVNTARVGWHWQSGLVYW